MNNNRPMSWSQISCFEYSRDDWYDRYVLGKRNAPTAAMTFGKDIGDAYEYADTFQREYKLETKIGDVPLIGYIDAFDLTNKVLIELKTGKKWDKKKANSHGQIDLYCAMLYLIHKIKPEDLTIQIIWLATEQATDFSTQFTTNMQPVIFPVKKTMRDVVNIMAKVKRIKKEMAQYALDRSTIHNSN